MLFIGVAITKELVFTSAEVESIKSWGSFVSLHISEVAFPVYSSNFTIFKCKERIFAKVGTFFLSFFGCGYDSLF